MVKLIRDDKRIDIIDDEKGLRNMNWIYWAELFDSKFQAGCLKTRMEQDWWVIGYESPDLVQVVQLKNGKYSVRFTWHYSMSIHTPMVYKNKVSHP